ncbi:MAG: exodeoxyribonuclease VII small subunit [Lautropia sp.]
MNEPISRPGGAADTAGAAAAESAAPDATPASFETAMIELEALIGRMEDGRLPLEDSLAAYQRGVVLVKYCRDTLGAAAQRVRILEADLLQPFDGAVDVADD